MLLGSVVKNYKYEQEILDNLTHIPSFVKIHQVVEQLEVDRLIYIHTYIHTHTTSTYTHTHTHTHTSTHTEHEGLET
jgi:hypothetical protein